MKETTRQRLEQQLTNVLIQQQKWRFKAAALEIKIIFLRFKLGLEQEKRQGDEK